MFGKPVFVNEKESPKYTLTDSFDGRKVQKNLGGEDSFGQPQFYQTPSGDTSLAAAEERPIFSLFKLLQNNRTGSTVQDVLHAKNMEEEEKEVLDDLYGEGKTGGKEHSKHYGHEDLHGGEAEDYTEKGNSGFSHQKTKTDQYNKHDHDSSSNTYQKTQHVGTKGSFQYPSYKDVAATSFEERKKPGNTIYIFSSPRPVDTTTPASTSTTEYGDQWSLNNNRRYEDSNQRTHNKVKNGYSGDEFSLLDRAGDLDEVYHQDDVLDTQLDSNKFNSHQHLPEDAPSPDLMGVDGAAQDFSPMAINPQSELNILNRLEEACCRLHHYTVDKVAK